MRKKINLALITIGIVIAGVILVTGIVRFNNRNKTEVNDNKTSTSISEQVDNTESSATSAESNIEIIEDETSISDDALTSSNAGGSSDPVEVEITEDGVVTDKPEPYPDEYSQITQPEDSENSENNEENSAESGDIKDVGPSIDLNDPDEAAYFVDDSEIKTELPPRCMTEDEFVKMVQESGTTLH